MEAYYDKEKKRWIFPGEDPNEVAKPLAPPPIMSVKKKEEDSGKETAAKESNDPLSSLMAPPSRTPNRSIGSSGDPLKDLMAPPQGLRGARTAGGGHYSEPRMRSNASRTASMNIPASAKKPVSGSAGSKPATPHFVIFQQPASSATQNSNEEKSE